MSTSNNLRCRIHDTVIELHHGNIAEVEADALVSNDDVYLSMSGGVGQAINKAAGPRLQDDVRKFTLPREFGTTVVTGAGSLKAKYIFHTLIRDFVKNENVRTIVPNIVRHILDLAMLLNIKSVALPLIGSGTMGVSEKVIVEYIFNSAMFYLAGRSYQIDKLIIVLYEQDQLQEFLEQMFKKALATNELQKQIRMMQNLFEALPYTDPLRPSLAQSLITARHNLQNQFRFDALAGDPQVGHTISGAANQSVQEKLASTLARLRGKQKEIVELQKSDQRRLTELQARERPMSSEPVPELEELQTRIHHRQQELNTFNERVKNLEEELEFLKQERRIELFEILTKRCNIDDLKTLLFYLDEALEGLTYEDLKGDNKPSKARSLIEHMELREQLSTLVEAGRRMREDIEWPDL